MWVCLCNQFNDATVRAVLEKMAPNRMVERREIKTIYKECARGASPQCGKCLNTALKDLINAHNDAVAQKTGQVIDVKTFIPANDAAPIPPPGAGGCGNCKCGTGGPRCI